VKVIVACEFSGIVRDAFIAKGYDAISCDLLPTEQPGPHIQGDIRHVRLETFDLMIAHPDCTYLTVSGLHWNGRIPGRAEKSEEALAFVQWLLDAPVAHIALENPVGLISSRIRKPDQTIQPWQFGHPESKGTCFWLKDLPALKPTNILTPTRFQPNGRPQWQNQTPSGQNKLGPSADRWKIRSRTYRGIAEAMADQWGGFVAAALQNSHERSILKVEEAKGDQPMSEIAFTVINDTPKDGKYWRLVVADSTGGYRPLKETGAPSDPFYVAKGPIWFDTRDAGLDEAERRNRDELHLTVREAANIVIQSMARQFAATGKGR